VNKNSSVSLQRALRNFTAKVAKQLFVFSPPFCYTSGMSKELRNAIAAGAVILGLAAGRAYSADHNQPPSTAPGLRTPHWTETKEALAGTEEAERVKKAMKNIVFERSNLPPVNEKPRRRF
jgi:hypothetical protein